MTKASDIRFQLQFMSLMMMTGRVKEAEKALGKVHALLDQMDQDDKVLEKQIDDLIEWAEWKKCQMWNNE